MSGVQLSLERTSMFLGVLLDSELKFSKHINHTCKKISKTIGILFRIRHFIPKKVAMNIYYALAYPYLNYNILVWGSTFSTHLHPLLCWLCRYVDYGVNSNMCPFQLNCRSWHIDIDLIMCPCQPCFQYRRNLENIQ